MPFPKSLLAALALFPLLAAMPARAEQPIAVSGPYTLTLSMIKDDLAVTQFAARRPLSAAEQAQVVLIDMAQFRREPAWSCRTLHREASDLKALRRMDAVRLAGWRKDNVVSAYFHRESHLTPQENQACLAICTRANPVVSADPASGTVVTESDMAAWQAAARLVAAQTHSPMTWTCAAMLKFLQDPKLPRNVREDAGHMERNWAIYRRGWAHEPAADRRSALAGLTQIVRQFAAQGQPAVGLGGAALHLGALAYSDYPYLLDPHFAVLKYKIIAGIIRGLAMTNSYNQMQGMQQMMNSYNRTLENGRQQQQDDYNRQVYEDAVRRR